MSCHVAIAFFFLLTSSSPLNRYTTTCVLSHFSCVRLFAPLPGSSVHGILQAIILEWVAISFSRDLPDPEIGPLSLTLLHLVLWQADSLPLALPRKPQHICAYKIMFIHFLYWWVLGLSPVSSSYKYTCYEHLHTSLMCTCFQLSWVNT